MNGEEVRKDVKERDKFATFLTVEEVQKTKEFETLTRKEAEEYIESIRQYCLIVYKQYSKQSNPSDNIKKVAA
ncbi:MAG: hypothetical protein JKY48_03060 [Flavobacteriales bacterium]|nr:hypothetical protein [Flavobacteriales bacterium]